MKIPSWVDFHLSNNQAWERKHPIPGLCHIVIILYKHLGIQKNCWYKDWRKIVYQFPVNGWSTHIANMHSLKQGVVRIDKESTEKSDKLFGIFTRYISLYLFIRLYVFLRARDWVIGDVSHYFLYLYIS